MRLTAAQLNRTTLGRQLLLRREPLAPAAALHRVVAVQAQHPASPYLALWNRVAGFSAADLDAAFADGTAVKATLLRATLHAVHGPDYAVLHAAMRPTLRAGRLRDRRFGGLGLAESAVEEVLPHVLAFAATRPRSNAEFATMIGEHLGTLPEPGLWWALRMFAPVRHAPTGGPWSFGDRPSYLSARSYAGADADVLDPEQARQAMVRRLLAGFGPASVADLAQFTRLPRASVRSAVAASTDLVHHEGPDGAVLVDVPDGRIWPARAAAPPRLLPMWDSVLLAYADRSRTVPDAHRRHVVRVNGDVLPTLLVDGHVAGVWRTLDGRIEASAFEPLSARIWRAFGAQARELLRFVSDREPAVYRRYAHWWPKLPPGEVRLLG